MADSFPTLADIAKINDVHTRDMGVTDLLSDAPLLARLAATESSNGETHKYVKETGAPTVGFRSANDGREQSKSEDTVVTATLKIFDASNAIDKAVADIHGKGAEYVIARRNKRHLKAGFSTAEKQFLYGTGNNADGFSGLANNTGLDAVGDTMVVNAGGTTANTASDVWFIRTNDDETDCMVVGGGRGSTGENGFNIEQGETIVQAWTGATGTFPAYYTPITAWMGMQIGSAYSVGRIVNVTADNGATLTDDLIAEMLSKFPASRMPNLIVMSRRSRKQLQQSRTATNSTGAPAPFPVEAFMIPIVTTDSIGDARALVA